MAFVLLHGTQLGFDNVKDSQIQMNLHPDAGAESGPRIASPGTRLFRCLHTKKQEQQTMEISQGTALGAAYTRWNDATFMLS